MEQQPGEGQATPVETPPPPETDDPGQGFDTGISIRSRPAEEGFQTKSKIFGEPPEEKP